MMGRRPKKYNGFTAKELAKKHGVSDTTIRNWDKTGKLCDDGTIQHTPNKERLITFNGETRNLSEWSRLLGIRPMTLHRRIATMPPDQALTKPRNDKGGNKITSRFNKEMLAIIQDMQIDNLPDFLRELTGVTSDEKLSLLLGQSKNIIYEWRRRGSPNIVFSIVKLIIENIREIEPALHKTLRKGKKHA